MLYVIFNDNLCRTAHVGTDLKLTDERIEAVESVQADGDELARITTHYRNLPFPPAHMRVVRWYGDDAKFIAANW